jgi:crotonobetainyl-CoA:carnitine CoA-transferase CaiB-like acyl-CoA transferase
MNLLDGVRVLEAGQEVACPYAGRLLAGLGAEVTRLEALPVDPIRREGPLSMQRAGFFHWLNAGKHLLPVERSALAEGVLELSQAADIILLGCPPFGMDEADDLISAIEQRGDPAGVVQVSPFGATGPWRDYRATELLEFLAFARFSDMGVQGRPPVRYAPHAAEFFAGTHAAVAALAALRHAGATVRPAVADLSIAETILTSPDRYFALYPFVGAPLPRPEVNPEVFAFTKDGRVHISAGLAWERIARMIGRADLADDPKFSRLTARTRNAPEIYALLAAWAAEHTTAEVVQALNEHRVLGGPMYRPDEVLQDPHFRARRFFETFSVEDAKPVEAPGYPFKVDGERPRLEPLTPAPLPMGEGSSGLTPAFASSTDRSRNRNSTQSPVLSAQSLPLTGVRVIDLGEVYAGPNACALLADLGADVIKIENVRRMPAIVRGDLHPLPAPVVGYFGFDPGEQPWERFFFYHVVERNKRAITLDLKAPECREPFLKLVATSDIVISNYTPRGLESLGLGYDELRAAKPDIVFVHLAGFGTDGPYADNVAVASVAEAASGFWAMRGYGDSDPLRGNATVWSDVSSGATAAFAALAALRRRDLSGAGALIDQSQAEVMSCFAAQGFLEWGWNGWAAHGLGDKDRFMAPHGCCATQGEDAWVAIAVPDDDTWPRLAEAIDRPDLAADAELAHLEGRKRREAELDDAISAWTDARTGEAAARYLQERGVPCVPLLHDDQVAGHPQVVVRGSVEDVDHSVVGRYPNTAGPYHFRGLKRPRRRPPTLLGEHNREVLCGLLGGHEESFTDLEQRGLIGTRFLEGAGE